MADPNRLNYSACAFWCFLLSIVLLPIGLGGNRPIPLGLAQAGLAASGLLIAFHPALWRTTPLFTRVWVALSLLAAVMVWAFIQTLTIVPASWAHPLWQEAASVLGKPIAGSISIVPEEALKGLMRLLTYSFVGILAYILAQDPRRARQFVAAFWVTGTVLCLYGLIVHLSGMQQILWFEKWAYTDDLTGTFVNRNHFAIYAGMVLVSGVALLIQSWRENFRQTKAHQRVEKFRHWLLTQGLPRSLLLTFVFFCITLSHSRAGLLWSVTGLCAYILFYQIYRKSWGRAIIVGLIIVGVMVGTVGIATQMSERFSNLFEDYSSQTRAQVYQISWRALADNPWLGYGLNGFEPEFRLYQQNMYEVFNHAHSDVLESLLDLGFIGGLALWTALALLLSGLWHGICHRRQNGMFPALGLAVSLMVLGHAMVDFDLQIPGVAMTWTALLGIGLAQSWPTAEKRSSKSS